MLFNIDAEPSLVTKAGAVVLHAMLSTLIEPDDAADIDDTPKPGLECGVEIRDDDSTSFCARAQSSPDKVNGSSSAFLTVTELVPGNGSFSP